MQFFALIKTLLCSIMYILHANVYMLEYMFPVAVLVTLLQEKYSFVQFAFLVITDIDACQLQKAEAKG